jgi:replicative DNA helicase
MKTPGKTHTYNERREEMAYSSGRGFGKTNTKDESLATVPNLKDLAQIATPEAIADEWGVMSCILTSNKPEEVFLQVAQILEPKHFAFPLLQDIWRIMLKMHSQRLPIEYTILQCHLQDTYEKNQEFFDEFVPKMYESTHDEEHVKFYAERILSKYHRRSLISTFSEGITAAVSHMTPADALTELERKLAEVRQEIHSCKKTKGGSSFRSIMQQYVADLRGRLDGSEPLNTIQTQNWYDFNQASQGFAPGDLIVIAAPTSCGKSMTGIGLAREFALGGSSVLYASLEMPKEEVAEKITSPLVGFSATSMNRTGAITEEKINLIAETVEKYANMHIAIKKPHRNNYDSFLKSVAEAEAEAREELGDDFKGFRVVVVDYLQLLAADINPQFKTQAIDSITQLLRNYALENNCTVIALAQYDTETSKSAKEPQNLNCLSYCKTIDHHATQVVMMYHPYFGDRQKIHDAPYIDYIWMKNRDGENGRVRMGVDWKTGWLYSTTSTGKNQPEPAPVAKSDPWEKLAEKYGTPTKTKKSKEIAESSAEEMVIELPELNPTDPLLAIATPLGADAELVQQMQSLDTDFDEEDEVTETLAEEALEDPESATLTIDVQPAEETTEIANEAVESTGETIEINGEVYEIGEDARFSSGTSSQPVFGLVKILGTAEYGCVKIQHLDTIRWDASTHEYSGKEFRWKEGKTDEVHPSRISKKI